MAGATDIPAFRSMRTLRALRPLRAVSRWEGMRVSKYSHEIFKKCKVSKDECAVLHKTQKKTFQTSQLLLQILYQC